mmetsp:Transcript_3021/g.9135  ORF Transcript_3021/g.9135 Transcript_3021/m.9135 type:complete len:219 (+) Transcript_3021:789-1445(+)
MAELLEVVHGLLGLAAQLVIGLVLAGTAPDQGRRAAEQLNVALHVFLETTHAVIELGDDLVDVPQPTLRDTPLTGAALEEPRLHVVPHEVKVSTATAHNAPSHMRHGHGRHVFFIEQSSVALLEQVEHVENAGGHVTQELPNQLSGAIQACRLREGGHPNETEFGVTLLQISNHLGHQPQRRWKVFPVPLGKPVRRRSVRNPSGPLPLECLAQAIHRK